MFLCRQLQKNVDAVEVNHMEMSEKVGLSCSTAPPFCLLLTCCSNIWHPLVCDFPFIPLSSIMKLYKHNSDTIASACMVSSRFAGKIITTNLGNVSKRIFCCCTCSVMKKRESACLSETANGTCPLSEKRNGRLGMENTASYLLGWIYTILLNSKGVSEPSRLREKSALRCFLLSGESSIKSTADMSEIQSAADGLISSSV